MVSCNTTLVPPWGCAVGQHVRQASALACEGRMCHPKKRKREDQRTTTVPRNRVLFANVIKSVKFCCSWCFDSVGGQNATYCWLGLSLLTQCWHYHAGYEKQDERSSMVKQINTTIKYMPSSKCCQVYLLHCERWPKVSRADRLTGEQSFGVRLSLILMKLGANDMRARGYGVFEADFEYSHKLGWLC